MQPSGDTIVAATIPELRLKMRDIVGEGVRELVVDLTGVRMVDSSGIGLLISAYNSLRKAGGQLAVIHASNGDAGAVPDDAHAPAFQRDGELRAAMSDTAWTTSLIQDYLAECREHLATIETDLLAIEQGGADIDEQLVNRVFRAAHSIKGGAGFFDLAKIRELAHKTENALDLIRSRQMAPTPEVVSILLMAFDKLREMIAQLPGEQPGRYRRVHLGADLADGRESAGGREEPRSPSGSRSQCPRRTSTSRFRRSI